MIDKKLTELNEATSMADSDIFPIVSDPSGNAETKKITKANAFKDLTPPLDIKGSVINDLPTYSTEFLLDTGWTSADWTGSWAVGWTHTTGNTTVLSQSKVAVNNTKYQISYTVTGRTAGSFIITFGGVSSIISSEGWEGGIIATGAFGPTTVSTASLTITPTTDFDGTIVISIKSITDTSTSLVNLKSSDDITRIETRVNTGSGNSFIGVGAGQYNTTGWVNTAYGYNALLSNTTGRSNTAIGDYALYSNTTGWYNTAYGYNALFANTIGPNNTAIGGASMYHNTSGEQSVAVGVESLYSNTTGYNNTAIGQDAMFSNTTGWNNTVVGINSLQANTTGRDNIGIGPASLFLNTTGSYNTIIGSQSLYLNTTGSNNVTLGYRAGACELGSNAFYVNNINQGTTENDKAYSLLYGTFAGSAGTTVGNKLTVNGNLLGGLMAPEGFLINGKIAVSLVNTNHLFVELKGLDGNDPSVTNPVYCVIGGVVRSITSALNLTLIDGYNWCNAGSTELATKEVDYFLYLYYSSQAGQDQPIGLYLAASRLPYGTVCGDFATADTSEKSGTPIGYFVAEGSTLATDPCVVIGRFAATLSASPGYTWSVPTFTSSNLIQKPVYETRVLTYTPTFTWTTTAPTTLTTVGKYRIIGSKCWVLATQSGTSAGSTDTQCTITVPFGASSSYTSGDYHTPIVSNVSTEVSSTLPTAQARANIFSTLTNTLIYSNFTSLSAKFINATGEYEI